MSNSFLHKKIVAIIFSAMVPFTLSANADEAVSSISQSEFINLCRESSGKYGNSETEKILSGIKQGFDLNQKITGRTLFSYIAQKGNADLIKAALAANADPNAVGMGGYTPLMLACGLRDLPVVQAFLSSDRLNWNMKSEDGDTALLYAYANDRKIALEILKTPLPKEAVKALGSDGDSLLTRILRKKSSDDIPLLEALQVQGADFNEITSQGLTSLQTAFTNYTPGLSKFKISYSKAFVEAVIKAGAKVSTRNSNGDDALHYLSDFPIKSELYQLLLDTKPDLEILDKEGNTALLRLFTGQIKNHETRRDNICRMLIKAGADINAVNKNGENALMLASAVGCARCVTDLLEAGAQLKPQGINSIPLLFYAIEGDLSSSAVAKIIEAGADVNEIEAQSKLSPLMLALMSGADDSISRKLIDAGADVNFTDSDGRTPLMAMAFHSPLNSLAEQLLNKGAKIRTKDKDGKTALDYLNESPLASNEKYKKYIDKTKSYLDLDEAVAQKCNRCIDLLLDNGVKPGAASQDTILFSALTNGISSSCIGKLTDSGANVNARDKESGMTILHRALSENYREDVVRILIEKGADINAQNNKGQTPLMLLFNYKISSYLVSFLIKNGARTDVQDAEGKNALDYLSASKFNEDQNYGREIDNIKKLLKGAVQP